ncbi:MAG TPA: SDR family oxidoreductase [Solirubrobacteraceae bacterium]|nr:SDR family oxidoreductase [Solirubrobacteraceae bacterium]
MIVAIAGAHGKIALRLTDLLVSGGDSVIGLIRNPDHAGEVGSRGASPVVCDLERASVHDITAAIAGADAVVFAAGAGPGSGAERKLTMDRDGAVKLLEAAAGAGADRYLIISSVGAERPPSGEDVFSVYLRAKAEADQAVQSSDRAWTIVRPGRLTDDPGTGRARVEREPFRGEVAREDVATVLARLLHEPRAIGQVLYVNGGDEPIDAALKQALAGDED